ncbi:MAG: hypothetical protein RL024_1092, partial [Actinomycetota bacterium]
PAGGVNEKFLEFTNLEVMGEPFVPPAQISEDGKVAVVTIPLEKSDEVEVVTERVTEMRELAAEGMPSGLEVYLTGPEGFQADLNNVFAGADFTLLLSTVIVVAVLLLITYRSPVLWLVPLLVVGTADGMAGQLGRQVATLFGMVPDGSVTGILSVLVFGAGTNYALLLIARYREELLLEQDRHIAMAKAVRGAGPAIIASGSTVTLALLTLTLAELGGNRTLGLVCASGIIIAMVAALGVLPAALVVFGRGLFWPFVPRFGGENKSLNGLWGKLGRAVSKRPAIISSVGVLILAGLRTCFWQRTERTRRTRHLKLLSEPRNLLISGTSGEKQQTYRRTKRSFLGRFCIMLQYVEKFSRSTLNRMIGRKFLLLHREHAEFFGLSTRIWVDRWKVSA